LDLDVCHIAPKKMLWIHYLHHHHHHHIRLIMDVGVSHFAESSQNQPVTV